MKAVRLYAPGDLRTGDEPVPVPGPGEVLLRVRAVGVCASDVHYYNEGRIGDQIVTDPLILGHEVGAEVVEIGPGVSGLSPGDRVAVEPGQSCGKCDPCRRGWPNLCPAVRFFGTPPVDGALREFVAWPARLCIKLPPGMSFEEAAMTEPMAVGIYAVDLANIQGGEKVAILGAGGIGLSVLQAARVAGAGKIWVTDPLAERCRLALRLGADRAIEGDPEAAALAVRDESGGPDVVFECAGTNEAVQQAVAVAGFNARVIIVGIPYPDEVYFTASTARRKNLTLIFVRRSRDAVERAIEWARDGRIDLKSLVTHRFPLEETDRALRLARDRADGVVRAVIEI
ncbi:MAG: NAD(P)-dependent alcohol dehydrogenase [Armatimonadota bacterium]